MRAEDMARPYALPDGGYPMLESLEPRLLLTGTTYVVDALPDVVASDGVVTLREAIEAADTNSAVTSDVLAGSATEVDIITFDQAALQAEAGPGNPLTITLNGSQLEITDDLDIQGLGEDVLSIDADGQSRVLYVSDGETEVELTGLTITGGSSTYDGGGIYNDEGTLTLTNSTVSGNSATGERNGGGIYSWYGTVTLTNSTVSGNSARDGGGIYSWYGTLTLANSTVSGNSAPGNDNGGGIYIWYGTVRLINSTVSDNSANYCGGGISIYVHGGGIYNYEGTATLINSTVSGNSATNKGGGMRNRFGTLTLKNAIVALNDAPDYADIYGSFTNNSSTVGVDPDFVRDPSPGADGVWGTPDDDYGDLRLLATSSAIDTGNNALLPADEFDLDGDADTVETLPVDLAGNQRIRGSIVDMGAYEFALAGDADDDGKVDGADLALWQQHYDPLGLNQNTFAMGDWNGDGRIDGADLALWQQNYNPLGLAALSQPEELTSQPPEKQVVSVGEGELEESTREEADAAAEIRVVHTAIQLQTVFEPDSSESAASSTDSEVNSVETQPSSPVDLVTGVALDGVPVASAKAGALLASTVGSKLAVDRMQGDRNSQMPDGAQEWLAGPLHTNATETASRAEGQANRQITWQVAANVPMAPTQDESASDALEEAPPAASLLARGANRSTSRHMTRSDDDALEILTLTQLDVPRTTL